MNTRARNRLRTLVLRGPRCAVALGALFVALIAAPAWAASYSFTSLGAEEANAVSADGSAVVGSLGFEAFRWTSEGGMVSLGRLNPFDAVSVALGVSADGSIVVGWGEDRGANDYAFRWTSEGGMQSLRDVLIAGGVSVLDDWMLESATGVSADGRTIVGWGTNPLGQNEAWIATVPEPSSAVLAGSGLMVLSVFARQRFRSRRRTGPAS